MTGREAEPLALDRERTRLNGSWFKGPWRLGLVALVATGAFIGALTRFPDARFLACTMNARTDAAYTARVFLPPTMTPQSRRIFLARQSQGVTVRISVSRPQSTITTARVCILAFPVKKPSLGVSDQAQQVAPGQYDVLLSFDPPGVWGARVVVVEPGRPAIAIPVNFTVPFPPPPVPSTTVP